MLKRLIILFLLVGISTLSNPASVVHFDLFDSNPKQDKTNPLYEISEKYGSLSQNKSLSALKKNQPPPSKQDNPDLYRLLRRTNQADASDFLNHNGVSEIGFFDDENQEIPEESKVAWKEIKTSIKDINVEWNRVENSVNEFLLEDVGLSNLNDIVAAHGIDLFSDTNDINKYAQTEAVDLNPLAYRDHLTQDEQALTDQPLFHFNLFYLLKLISDNIGKLILIVVLGFLIRGIVIFIKWKSEKRRNRGKNKKRRSIDGFTKY